MKGILDDIRDFLDGWLLDHVTPILIVFIGTTIGWLLGRPSLAGSGYYDVSTVISVINGFWKAYLAFSALTFVNWIVHIFWKVLQQLVEGLKDFFRW